MTTIMPLSQIDEGVDFLKRSGLLCPFVVVPQQYQLSEVRFSGYLCWFHAETSLQTRQMVEPLACHCGYSYDFANCPLYQSIAAAD